MKKMHLKKTGNKHIYRAIYFDISTMISQISASQRIPCYERYEFAIKFEKILACMHTVLLGLFFLQTLSVGSPFHKNRKSEHSLLSLVPSVLTPVDD